MAVEVPLVKLLLLLLVILLLALPLAAASVPLTWTRGVVESSFRQAHYGEVYHEPPPVRSRVGVTPVRESIYIDAGEWLYHVSQLVTTRGMANLREGDKVEVAVKGNSLILRAGGKERPADLDPGGCRIELSPGTLWRGVPRTPPRPLPRRRHPQIGRASGRERV